MSAAAPPPASFSAGLRDAGRACPYCRSELTEGADAIRCNACDSIHHAECWTANRGCAIVACAAGPVGPPVDAAPDRARSERMVIDVEPQRGGQAWLVIAVAILVAVLVLAGAGIVLFSSAAPIAFTLLGGIAC
jgi:hypothetical protein